jgi:hypothetical protein
MNLDLVKRMSPEKDSLMDRVIEAVCVGIGVAALYALTFVLSALGPVAR